MCIVAASSSEADSNDTVGLAVGLVFGLGGSLLLILIIFCCCLRRKSSSHRHLNVNGRFKPENDVAQPDWLPLSQTDGGLPGTFGHLTRASAGYKNLDLESGYNSYASRGNGFDAVTNEAYLDDEAVNISGPRRQHGRSV